MSDTVRFGADATEYFDVIARMQQRLEALGGSINQLGSSGVGGGRAFDEWGEGSVRSERIVSRSIGNMVRDLGTARSAADVLADAFLSVERAGKLGFGLAIGVGVGVAAYEAISKEIEKIKKVDEDLARQMSQPLTQEIKLDTAGLDKEISGLTTALDAKLKEAATFSAAFLNTYKGIFENLTEKDPQKFRDQSLGSFFGSKRTDADTAAIEAAEKRLDELGRARGKNELAVAEAKRVSAHVSEEEGAQLRINAEYAAKEAAAVLAAKAEIEKGGSAVGVTDRIKALREEHDLAIEAEKAKDALLQSQLAGEKAIADFRGTAGEREQKILAVHLAQAEAVKASAVAHGNIEQQARAELEVAKAVEAIYQRQLALKRQAVELKFSGEDVAIKVQTAQAVVDLGPEQARRRELQAQVELAQKLIDKELELDAITAHAATAHVLTDADTAKIDALQAKIDKIKGASVVKVLTEADSSAIEALQVKIFAIKNSSIGRILSQTDTSAIEALQAKIYAIKGTSVAKVLTEADSSAIDALQAKIDKIKGKSIPVFTEADTAAIDQLQQKIDAIKGKSVPVLTEADTVKIADYQSKIDALKSKTVEVRTEADTAAIAGYQAKIDAVKGKSVPILTEADTTKIADYQSKIDALKGPTTAHVLTDIDTAKIDALEKQIDEIQHPVTARVLTEADATKIEALVKQIDAIKGTTTAKVVTQTDSAQLDALPPKLDAVRGPTAAAVKTEVDSSQLSTLNSQLSVAKGPTTAKVEADTDQAKAKIAALQAQIGAVKAPAVATGRDLSEGEIAKVTELQARIEAINKALGAQVIARANLAKFNQETAFSDERALISARATTQELALRAQHDDRAAGLAQIRLQYEEKIAQARHNQRDPALISELEHELSLAEQIFKSNFDFQRSQELKAAKAVTEELAAQLLGEKDLAALINIRANAESKITAALREQKGELAQQEAIQARLNIEARLAADFRKTPQQRAADATEQHAQQFADTQAAAALKDLQDRIARGAHDQTPDATTRSLEQLNKVNEALKTPVETQLSEMQKLNATATQILNKIPAASNKPGPGAAPDGKGSVPGGPTQNGSENLDNIPTAESVVVKAPPPIVQTATPPFDQLHTPEQDPRQSIGPLSLSAPHDWTQFDKSFHPDDLASRIAGGGGDPNAVDPLALSPAHDFTAFNDAFHRATQGASKDFQDAFGDASKGASKDFQDAFGDASKDSAKTNADDLSKAIKDESSAPADKTPNATPPSDKTATADNTPMLPDWSEIKPSGLPDWSDLKPTGLPDFSDLNLSSLIALSGADFSSLIAIGQMNFSGLSSLNGLTITIQ